MKLISIFLLLIFSFIAMSGLPPTSSTGSGDGGNYVTTFKTNYGAIPITRPGGVATIGTIPITQGGTGKTTQQNTADIGITNTIGSPDISSLSDQMNHFLSAGVTDGGTLTDTGSGTVTVATSTVYIREDLTVTSLTRVSATATGTTATAHGYNVGDRIFMNGADQPQYNGFFLVTAATTFTFSYIVFNAPATPATGALIRSTDEHSTLHLVSVPAISNPATLTLVDHATNYLFVDYGSGSPYYLTTTIPSTFAGLAKVLVWTIAKEGNSLWSVDGRGTVVDTENKVDTRYHDTFPFKEDVGGSILSATGTRNFAISEGAFWNGLNEIYQQPFDTSGTSTFTYASTADSGTSWTYTAGQTQISNTQYDNIATGLQSITVGNYGVFWIYVMNNHPSTLMVVYGQGDYNKSQAFSAQEPLVKPSIVSGVGALVGKIIIKQGASSFTNVTSSFTKIFPNPAPDLDSLADVIAPSPNTGEFLGWNGVNWVNTPPTSISTGVGIKFYKTTPVITAKSANVNIVELTTLSQTPITTTEQLSSSAASVTGVTAAFSASEYDTTIGQTSIPAGLWSFSIYASIDSLTGITTVTKNIYQAIPYTSSCTITTTMVVTTATVVASGGCTPFTGTYFAASATNTTASYLRTPLGLYQISAVTDSTHMTMIVPISYTSETLTNNSSVRVYNKLFGVTSADFSSTAVSLLSIADTTQASFTINSTDKLASIDFITASTNGRTVNLVYNGNAHNSYFSAPFIVAHNNLPGLQGGQSSEYYHLTNSEYTGSGTGTFLRQSAPSITGHPTIESVTSTGATGTGKLVFDTSPVFTTPNIGSATGSISGNAATVTTNANLTGDVTSVGNATTIGSTKVTNAMLAGSIDLTTKVTGVLPLLNGGTGQTTKAPAFDALQPMNASGDIIYGGASGTGTRLAAGTETKRLSIVSGVPTWTEEDRFNLLANGNFENSSLSDWTATTGSIASTAVSGEFSFGLRGMKITAGAPSAIRVYQTVATVAGSITQYVVGTDYRFLATELTDFQICTVINGNALANEQTCVPTANLIGDGAFHTIEIPTIITPGQTVGIVYKAGSTTSKIAYIDRAYIKPGIGTQSLQLDNTFSATVSAAGTVSLASKVGWITFGSLGGTSTYTMNFASGTFSAPPNCAAGADDNLTIIPIVSTPATTSSIIIKTFTDAGVAAASAFTIHCQKSGNDYLNSSAAVYSQASANFGWTQDPTVTVSAGFGTITNKSVWYRRVGDELEVRGFFNAGPVTATGMTLTVPNGYLIDTTKLTSTTNVMRVGTINCLKASAGGMDFFSTDREQALYYNGSTNNLLYGSYNTQNGTFPSGGTAVTASCTNSDGVVFSYKIPIVGWSNAGSIVGSFAGVPTVAGAGVVDIFSISYGTTNGTTVCSANPCSYFDSTSTVATSMGWTSAGLMTLNLVNTYSKIKCTANGYGATAMNFDPIVGAATNALTVQSRNGTTAANSYGTITCTGSR